MPSDDFESNLDMELRWPVLGDVALNGSKWGAVIEKDPNARAFFMRMGYKLAADTLVEKALSDRYFTNKLVYPILFNYRQFIELSLKYFISIHGYFADVPPNSQTHDLEVLWPMFQKIVTYHGEGDIKALKTVEAIVAEFAKIDQGSFNFRYPTNRNGDPVKIGMEKIDLLKLREVMAGVANYFSCADLHLDSLRMYEP